MHRRNPNSRPMRVLALVAVLALAVVACGGAVEEGDPVADEVAERTVDEADSDPPEPEQAEGPLVVATTSILGDIVSTLVGEDGEVVVIMPPGADPHGFEPSAHDAALLREADLVVANGLMLEESLVSALAAAEEEGVRLFELADHLDPIGFDLGDPHADDHEDDHEHDNGHEEHDEEQGNDDHDHGPEDPHVWFDPVRMATGVQLIAAELAVVADNLDAVEWERRGEEYGQMLLALHEELEETLSAVPPADRQLVTNHDSLGYLAARYDFEVLGTVVPGASTQAETDARSFAELIGAVEAAGVTVVFAENTDTTTLADQLASEVVGRGDLDIEVVRIYTDALGEEGSGAETYPDLLRTTARLIADALG